MKTTVMTRGRSLQKPEKPRIVGKFLLKKLRFWAKFHKSVTVYEAFRHLVESPMPVFDRENFRDFGRSARPIERYLIHYCGFTKTNKRRAGFIVLEKTEPSALEKRASNNYWNLLNEFYHRDSKI